MKELVYYSTSEGKIPFRRWVEGLHEDVRRRIVPRLTRLSHGNFGDVKSVGGGVHELRIDFAGGYRIYFANDGDQIILILNGGEKSTQSKDIERAKQYYADYTTRKASREHFL